MSTLNSVTVSSVARHGKAFQVDGEWYSAFNPTQLNGVARGDTITFQYKEKESGGRVYKNVQGNVTIEGKSGNDAPASNGGSSSESSPPRRASSAYGRGTFPIPALDGQRSIIRQNSVTNAVNLMKDHLPKSGKINWDDYADNVIAVARKFEAYSTGDLDAEEAEKLMGESESETASDD